MRDSPDFYFVTDGIRRILSLEQRIQTPPLEFRNLNTDFSRVLAAQQIHICLSQGLHSIVQQCVRILDRAVRHQGSHLLQKLREDVVSIKHRVPFVPQLLVQDIDHVRGHVWLLVLVPGQDPHSQDASVRVQQVQRNLDRVIANEIKIDIEPGLTHRSSEGRALVLGLVVEGRVKAELVD